MLVLFFCFTTHVALLKYFDFSPSAHGEHGSPHANSRVNSKQEKMSSGVKVTQTNLLLS